MGTIQPNRPIVFYGAGSHAYVLHDILPGAGLVLSAMLNDMTARKLDIDVPVLIGPEIDDWLKHQDAGSLSYAISIGNHHGQARFDRHRLLRSKGLKPETLVHTTAHVSPSAELGEACQILAFALVGARAKLGEAVIINSGASIDHECSLDHGVHVAPGAVLAGRVSVGANTMIGAGAIVLPDISIASNVIIGAGAVVTRSIDEPGVYFGSPAKRRV